MIKCFWLEPTDRAEASLRRYERHSYSPLPPPSCPGNRMQYHDTTVSIGEIAFSEAERASHDEFPRDDPRWPRACDICGVTFRDEDHWQYNVKRLYSGAPDGKLYTIGFGPRRAPAGAMYDAYWYPEQWKGADGITLAVVLPGQDNVWLVDSRASNCTLPDDNEHRCWVRHGDPRTGNVHVDKNGRTCAAGAGSIQMGSYHGFLHNGSLTPA